MSLKEIEKFDGNVRFDSNIVTFEGLEQTEGSSNKDIVNVDMLRTGKFMRRGFFGDTIYDITDDMLNTMIQNFNDKVIERDVSIDVNHNGEESYGWLMSVSKESRKVKENDRTFLKGKIKLTENGKKILSDGSYKYFSIEYSPNFKQHEVLETIKTADGEEVAKVEKSFGPVIVGGAFTNRPFITNMEQVTFSDNEKEKNISYVIEFSEEQHSGKSSKNVVSSNRGEEKKICFFSGYKKEKEMNLIEFMEKKLSELDTNTDEYKTLNNEISKMKEDIKFAEQSKQKLSEAEKALKTAEKEKVTLNKQIDEQAGKIAVIETKLSEHASALAEERHRRRIVDIDSYVRKLGTTGHTKPVLAVVKEILLSDTEEKNVVKLSDGTELNLRSVISKVLDSIPVDQKVDMSEKSVNEAKEENVDKNDEEKFTDKYADAIKRGKTKGLKAYGNLRKTKSE